MYQNMYIQNINLLKIRLCLLLHILYAGTVESPLKEPSLFRLLRLFLVFFLIRLFMLPPNTPSLLRPFFRWTHYLRLFIHQGSQCKLTEVISLTFFVHSLWSSHNHNSDYSAIVVNYLFVCFNATSRTGLLLSKDGHEIFNVCNNLVAYSASAKVLTQKNWRTVFQLVSPKAWTHGSYFHCITSTAY